MPVSRFQGPNKGEEMPETIREEYLTYLDTLREQNEQAVVTDARPKLIREFGMEPDHANEVFHFWMGERKLVGSDTRD